MAQSHPRRVEVLVAPEYLEELETKDLDEVRAMLEECTEVETEVSYVRRLAQARIDIVRAEIDRRASGGSIGDLIAALPEILADPPPLPSRAGSRLPRHLGPAPAIEWRRGLEVLISDTTLVDLPRTPDEDLAGVLEQLRALEAETSERRRRIHEVIERLERAVAARHAADPA